MKMLSKERQKYVTASQAHRVMSGFESELNKPAKPDRSVISQEELDFMSKLDTMPKVGEMKNNGFESISGNAIKEGWKYLKSLTPIFSEGMESVAREIAMSEFIINRDEGIKTKDMERGHLQESESVQTLSKFLKIEFDNKGDDQSFLTKGNLGVTPDAIEYKGFDIKSCLEMKNPKDTTHMKYLTELRTQDDLLRVCPEYYWQAQCGLYVTDAETYHWSSYHNGFGEGYQVVYVPVAPAKEHINILIDRAERVMKRVPEIIQKIEEDHFIQEMKAA